MFQVKTSLYLQLEQELVIILLDFRMKPKIQECDYITASKLLDCEVEAIKAVAEVESNGDGFLSSGEPRILFEGHIFWRQLQERGINPVNYVNSSNNNVLYPKWTRAHYLGGQREHLRLQQAQNISKNHPKFREAALASASWGKFQIMGFNFKRAGFNDIQSFINAMYNSETDHLIAFCNFIKSDSRLLSAIRRKDWAKFAYYYNGSGYKVNKYDEKMANAYKRFKK